MLSEFQLATIDDPLDPRIHWPRKITNSSFGPWREFLKRALLVKRGYKSDLSGKSLLTEYFGTNCEMHEGIVTRANVPRSIAWSWMIYHEFNCFLLLPEEHRPQPPSRQWCIQNAYERYGRDAVRKWFYTLPFKVKPFELE